MNVSHPTEASLVAANFLDSTTFAPFDSKKTCFCCSSASRVRDDLKFRSTFSRKKLPSYEWDVIWENEESMSECEESNRKSNNKSSVSSWNIPQSTETLQIPDFRTLKSVFLFLPMHLATLLSVAATCRSWRILSDRLPHWRFLLPLKSETPYAVFLMKWEEPVRVQKIYDAGGILPEVPAVLQKLQEKENKKNAQKVALAAAATTAPVAGTAQVPDSKNEEPKDEPKIENRSGNDDEKNNNNIICQTEFSPNRNDDDDDQNDNPSKKPQPQQQHFTPPNIEINEPIPMNETAAEHIPVSTQNNPQLIPLSVVHSAEANETKLMSSGLTNQELDASRIFILHKNYHGKRSRGSSSAVWMSNSSIIGESMAKMTQRRLHYSYVLRNDLVSEETTTTTQVPTISNNNINDSKDQTTKHFIPINNNKTNIFVSNPSKYSILVPAPPCSFMTQQQLRQRTLRLEAEKLPNWIPPPFLDNDDYGKTDETGDEKRKDGSTCCDASSTSCCSACTRSDQVRSLVPSSEPDVVCGWWKRFSTMTDGLELQERKLMFQELRTERRLENFDKYSPSFFDPVILLEEFARISGGDKIFESKIHDLFFNHPKRHKLIRRIEKQEKQAEKEKKRKEGLDTLPLYESTKNQAQNNDDENNNNDNNDDDVEEETDWFARLENSKSFGVIGDSEDENGDKSPDTSTSSPTGAVASATAIISSFVSIEPTNENSPGIEMKSSPFVSIRSENNNNNHPEKEVNEALRFYPTPIVGVLSLEAETFSVVQEKFPLPLRFIFSLLKNRITQYDKDAGREVLLPLGMIHQDLIKIRVKANLRDVFFEYLYSWRKSVQLNSLPTAIRNEWALSTPKIPIRLGRRSLESYTFRKKFFDPKDPTCRLMWSYSSLSSYLTHVNFLLGRKMKLLHGDDNQNEKSELVGLFTETKEIEQREQVTKDPNRYFVRTLEENRSHNIRMKMVIYDFLLALPIILLLSFFIICAVVPIFIQRQIEQNKKDGGFSDEASYNSFLFAIFGIFASILLIVGFFIHPRLPREKLNHSIWIAPKVTVLTKIEESLKRNSAFYRRFFSEGTSRMKNSERLTLVGLYVISLFCMIGCFPVAMMSSRIFAVEFMLGENPNVVSIAAQDLLVVAESASSSFFEETNNTRNCSSRKNNNDNILPRELLPFLNFSKSAYFVDFPAGTEFTFHPPSYFLDSILVPFSLDPFNCSISRNQTLNFTDPLRNQGFKQTMEKETQDFVSRSPVSFPAYYSVTIPVVPKGNDKPIQTKITVPVMIIGNDEFCPFWSSLSSEREIFSSIDQVAAKVGDSTIRSKKFLMDPKFNKIFNFYSSISEIISSSTSYFQPLGDALNEIDQLFTNISYSNATFFGNRSSSTIQNRYSQFPNLRSLKACQLVQNSKVVLSSNLSTFPLRLANKWTSHFPSFYSSKRDVKFQNNWEDVSLDFKLNGIVSFTADRAMLFAHKPNFVGTPFWDTEENERVFDVLFSENYKSSTSMNSDNQNNNNKQNFSLPAEEYWTAAHVPGLRKIKEDLLIVYIVFCCVIWVVEIFATLVTSYAVGCARGLYVTVVGILLWCVVPIIAPISFMLFTSLHCSNKLLNVMFPEGNGASDAFELTMSSFCLLQNTDDVTMAATGSIIYLILGIVFLFGILMMNSYYVRL